MFGIIYEYCDIRTGKSAYVGKAAGYSGHTKALEKVHKRHLTAPTPVPFDLILRADERAFTLRIIDTITANTTVELQEILKPLEKVRIREHRPTHNHVRFIHFQA